MVKGQFLSADLLLAIVVFLIILVSSLALWEYTQQREEEIQQKRDINVQARFALQSLLQTPGNPASWENNASFNASQLGLVQSPFVLNKNKITSFAAWNSTNYSNYRDILGLQGYDFFLLVYSYDYSNSKYSSSPQYTIGKNVSITSTEIVRMERIVSLDNNWTKFAMVVWK